MTKTIVRRNGTKTTQLEFDTIHPLLRDIYINRGVNSLNDLERGIEHLLPFGNLLSIANAVQCLTESLQNQQRFLIIGDFDADGATSTALAVSVLQCFGAKHVDYLVPNRFEYGYGLTPEIVQVASQKSPDIIVTVDNGISSCAGVKAAKSLGIKVVITDHHLPGPELPIADAIVNPNQRGDLFPSKNLAGVGVIFYVMLALRAHLRSINWFSQHNIPEPNMSQFLDLVALGTVADVVPLDRNNRILVHQGLQRIKSEKCRPGIKALLSISKRQADRITATDLGFAIAPRLNAAGRLDDMSLGIACLLNKDFVNACEMAQQLDALNQERRTIETEMQQQALTYIEKLKLNNLNQLPLGLCLYESEWHQGVIGIIAGRVKDLYHRPVIAFAQVNDQEIKGSARSITQVHIKDVLEAISTEQPYLISKFGGHAMAAGLTLPIQNYQSFCEAFNNELQKHINNEDIKGQIISDGELSHEHFQISVAQMIRDGGPWGQHFPEPLFDGNFEVVNQRVIGGKHLKLMLQHPQSKSLLEGIAFGIDLNIWPNSEIKLVRVAYRLDINEYRGLQNMQLLIEHLEPIFKL